MTKFPITRFCIFYNLVGLYNNVVPVTYDNEIKCFVSKDGDTVVVETSNKTVQQIHKNGICYYFFETRKEASKTLNMLKNYRNFIKDKM